MYRPWSLASLSSLSFLGKASLCAALAVLLSAAPAARAGDMRISIPKRTKPTPVQQLNRDGVRAIQKHNYEQAKKLFYKAYLLDPNDPFTLNNLGYISELEGELERAQRYYGLAADLSSDATIDKASDEAVEGKSVAQVAGNTEDKSLEINRLNVEAMSLLKRDRASEAEFVLGRALQLDPHNPYTLNNIGFTREQEGELESALSYYSAAAHTGSQEPVVVTINKDWRGKPIGNIAGDNAKKVQRDLDKRSEDSAAEVARLNLRGVSALNRNDRKTARDYFQKAYKLDENNAFTLNNMGYLAELDGDRETAQFYYNKAKDSDTAGRTIGVATRKEAEGKPVGDVAEVSDQKVDARMAADLAIRRAAGGPVELKRRDGSAIAEPAAAVHPSARPSEEIRLPANDSGAAPARRGKPVQGQPTNDVIPPLPDNQQPPATGQPNQQQPQQGQPVQEIIPPLPDSQQPPAVQQQKPNSPTQPPVEGQRETTVIPPLPDDQQPPEVRQQQQNTKPDQKPKPPQN